MLTTLILYINVAKMKKDRKILNVGCGNETYGTDFIDLYPSRSEVKKVFIGKERFPYKNDFFDEVYSNCVLEHLVDIGHFIKECKRVLKKNGKIIIITDNAACYKFHIHFFPHSKGAHHGRYEILGRVGGGTGKSSEDKHYSLFTPTHLKNLFDYYGIKTESLEYLFGYKRNRINKILDFLMSLVDRDIVHPQIKIIGQNV
jgi:SAM-dependent methyltransferase